MGYYSSVAYVIAFEDEQVMGQFIQHVFGSEDEHMINALKECEVSFPTLRINFYHSSCKWYESYSDVQGHTRLYNLVNDEDTLFHGKCDYRFIRIGEESEDVEETGSYGDHDPYDGFYVVRTMELPFAENFETYGSQLEKLTPPQLTEGETK